MNTFSDYKDLWCAPSSTSSESISNKLIDQYQQPHSFTLIFILIVAEIRTLTEEDLGHLDGFA